MKELRIGVEEWRETPDGRRLTEILINGELVTLALVPAMLPGGPTRYAILGPPLHRCYDSLIGKRKT